MATDPFYEQILAGLNGTLNPQDFEDCMADLLRELFPTLVPVRGGKDSGMDGAIADGEGEPFPLVTTTATDGKRNLGDSLNSWVERKQPSRKAIFATSQALTPQRRLKLMDAARERGFTLLQVIEQRGVANLLYKSPRWYKQLLGLSGKPSALSVVPRSRRPLLDLEPIGRAGDLEWLQQTTGDRVLSGEPGSGKTFLLYHLARQGWGLFLADPNGDVAGALREQRPGIVIVDDAHVEPDVLVNLRHLRERVGMDFSIVASTWEGARNEVMEAMGGIPESKVRKLELLTRSEILEVFRSAGVEEDAGTMRYLIDQAANKPGLAVTIATLWLAGSWREVIDGKALSRTLLTFFKEFVGPEATDVLAAFSLGGDRGMGVETVRDFLGLTRPDLLHAAVGLAAGGVLSEVDKETWAVRPLQLRTSLIRTVFFSSPGRSVYRYQELFDKAPNPGKAVETLIAAKSVGAEVPVGELRHLVAGVGSLRAWSSLAQLSEQDARWVLENYPGDIVGVGGSTLLLAPEPAIRALLERASSATEPIHSNHHPMSILLSWVQDIEADSQELIHRRRLIARAAKEFLLSGGKAEVGVHGICIGLNRKVHGDSLDPSMTSITHWSGFLPVQSLREIEIIWTEAKSAIQYLDAASWQHLLSTLRDWSPPKQTASRRDVSEEERQIRRSFVERMLRDLLPMSEDSPGLQTGMSRLARELGVELEVGEDEVLELLYPPLAKRKEQVHLEEDVRKLAADWAKGSPEEIAIRIAFYEKEAQKIGEAWMNNMPELIRALAESVEEPAKWIDSLLTQDLSGDLFFPFLKKVVESQRDGWELQVEEYLENDRLVRSTALLILRISTPPPSLLDHALAKVQEDAELVERLCIQRRVPLPTLRTLLRLPFWETALAAALGEWWAEPQGKVREEILTEWRDAILRMKIDDDAEETNRGFQYRLGVILASNGELALDWLLSRLKDSNFPGYFTKDSPFAQAINALGKEQRERLLKELDPALMREALLSVLIGKDAELYRSLLAIGPLAAYHLHPLGGLPGTGWEGLALAALDAGYTPEDIARAAFRTSQAKQFGWGLEYEHWKSWDQAFAAFENHPREGLREVARHGKALAQEELDRVRCLQRQIDLRGFGG